MNDKTMETAMRTARSGGAVGPKAKVPLLVLGMCHPDDLILDYGCGYGDHVAMLDGLGYQVDGHDLRAPIFLRERHYDIVYLSNVLNVIDNLPDLVETIEESIGCSRELWIANLPASPRKCAEVTGEVVLGILMDIPSVGKVENVGTVSAPIFQVEVKR